jgi:glycosyltransferase involved in cell wall biosynthesis
MSAESPEALKPAPTVSICMPAFNAEQTIGQAVRSALDQTYSDLEVVVVDNASTDRTIERVLEIDDPRLSLYANSHNVGVTRNFNRSISLARGRYVKFLCSDDVLLPDCVQAMVGVFESDPRVGLVFSPREVTLEDPGDPIAVQWKAKHERSHTHFGELREMSSGEELLEAWIADQLANNWIGEPTNVMMSRECLRRTGTFHLRMHDRADMDLWVRAMLFSSVGFVNRPLSGFLVRPGSLSSFNRRSGQAWLDRLWFLEGLLAYEEVRLRYPQIRWLRTKALAGAARKLRRGRAPRNGKLAGIKAYLGYRLRGRGDRARLYGTLDDRGPLGETAEVKRRDLPRRVQPIAD